MNLADEHVVYSIFGEHGDNFMEDLMKTDTSIIEGIASSGSIETLLGSVYSPFRLPGLGSPQVSNALLSPSNHHHLQQQQHMSPTRYSNMHVPLSPHMEIGHVRRSARLTPTRIFANPEYHVQITVVVIVIIPPPLT